MEKAASRYVHTLVLIIISFSFPMTVSAECEGDCLTAYVEQCKNKLGFESLPAFNCNQGLQFHPPLTETSLINDYVGYYKVNNDVDLTFACRWLRTEDLNSLGPGPFVSARSIELMIHKRDTGATCFFSAKESDLEFGNKTHFNRALTQMLSVTDPNADEYWRTPEEVNAEVRCVGCHVAGPVIASSVISPFLERFGLLNNGHDTHNFMSAFNPNGDPEAGRYHAFGDVMASWNDLITSYSESGDCGSGCHAIGTGSPQSTIVVDGFPLLANIPLILSLIDNDEVMPPLDESSPYRSINLDSLAGDGDNESFSQAKEKLPVLMSTCIAPGKLEAHAVGSPVSFSTTDNFPDELALFNVKEGLLCIDRHQVRGFCNDYETRYFCEDNTATGGYWTHAEQDEWYDLDDPFPTADNETRSTLAANGILPCDGAEPIAMQARTSFGGLIFTYNAPSDRLAEFNAYGLHCKHTDQPDGECSNYVVKYKNCREAPTALQTKIRSDWSAKLLTATKAVNNAETRAQPNTPSWPTQNWIIEPLVDSPWVRIKNASTGLYLNVEEDREFSMVRSYELREDWGSQLWILEYVKDGGGAVRLRNQWTNRYLTVRDQGDYAEIRAQDLRRHWPSQRWQLSSLNN